MNKTLEFYIFFARKIVKIPESRIVITFAAKSKKIPILQDFCPKNTRILHNNWQKNIFPEFYGGTRPLCHPPCPSPSVSYAYALCNHSRLCTLYTFGELNWLPLGGLY